MESSLCTFIDIFKKEIDCGKGEKLCPQKIIIPIIQRDYAQGRNSAGIGRVRSRFLDALYKAVTENPVTLDFIYGDIDEKGILTPLDGQQRLTTLFLLHWYAAKKCKISSEKTEFLKNFSYAIRPDARDFCERLVEFNPPFTEKILSEEIENQAWFPLNWKKDPTVDAMLRMLDDIYKKFCNVPDLWEKLEGGAISFHFLSIKNIGAKDELYITMNSRGKPLTDFEHFKAEFQRKLEEIDENLSRRIILKIDTTWTDLLWQFRDKNISESADKKNSEPIVDDMFLNYFRFLCDIIRYKRGGTSQGKSYDEFDLLDEFFSEDNARENVDFMEKSFNCWCDIADIEKFFDNRISLGDRSRRGVNHHQHGKIIGYNLSEKNIFKDCLKAYVQSSEGKRKFTLPKIILLYAFLKYLLERKSRNISDKELRRQFDEDFRRRIRIINNLVNNSEGTEISDSELAQSGNRLPAILRQVDYIITNGRIPNPNEKGFNTNQLKEEAEKLNWTAQNPTLAEKLFELEDHYLLYGQIAILGIENHPYFERFISLFNCDYDKIDCALITCGDYLQNSKISKTRYQLGTNRAQSWQNLFHLSVNNERFQCTQEFLIKLLELTSNFTDAFLEKIIADYLEDCESRNSFEWGYYYIKYLCFRPNRYGKYDWENFDSKPYQFIVLWANQRRSENSYQPFLKALEKLFKDHHCNYYLLEDTLVVESSFCIKCENTAYVIRDYKTLAEVTRLDINQHNGVDCEDRIKKFLNWQGKDALL